MKKENTYVLLFLMGLALISAFVFLSMRSDYKSQAVPAESESSPATSISTAPIDTSSPNYADLSPEEIQITDQAIGNLLNSAQGITSPMISVVSFTAREFSDASLDCPQAGHVAAQVITPGYQVILSAAEKIFDYRISGETVLLCE
ncbi:hypothetical protein COY14_00620 [Candidatus Roizmanbacteria bacterium CG_4_10_14_0_2_um_filter_36_9]|uniref:Uncharacterized protein n=1 Tax=Candidatus Roizmanbacteria bacterium CG_4_10_14_0_2_um_filter_36_9 TaxID=1974823 RepID=A0A2M7U5P8_9BACT|nr:MAG: hypothetical protein COY14_00620 [Candidatus Roizmanbacteria bacterium CG_4_10_14_0_2_um_filter_36_9]